ncbi:hypothetical protein D3C76_1711630 [compost metagenome]
MPPLRGALFQVLADVIEQGAGQADQKHAAHDQVHAQQLLGADHQAADAAA